MKKMYKFLLKDIVQNKRIYICYLVLVFIVMILWYFSYNIFMLKFYLQKQFDDNSNQLTILNQQLDDIRSSENYKKYSISKFIYDKYENIRWYNTINKLISMFDDIKKLQSEWWNLVLDDFIIDMDNVKIKWNVSSLQTLYISWWVINKFLDLPFVKEVNIPNYQKNGDNYQFNLNAKIKINEWNNH